MHIAALCWSSPGRTTSHGTGKNSAAAYKRSVLTHGFVKWLGGVFVLKYAQLELHCSISQDCYNVSSASFHLLVVLCASSRIEVARSILLLLYVAIPALCSA